MTGSGPEMSPPYDSAYFAARRERARASAAKVIAILTESMVPKSVIDVGCGTGSWLAEFTIAGAERIVGIDLHAPHELLEVPTDVVLRRDAAFGVGLVGRFDLAVSLEVAEHLPASAAATHVAELCQLAPVVLFGAAIPNQGGVGHVNEQWPQYWARLFANHGRLAVDCIRPAVWLDPEVAWWYAQNTLVYADPDDARGRAFLDRLPMVGVAEPMALVHPDLLTLKCAPL